MLLTLELWRAPTVNLEAMPFTYLVCYNEVSHKLHQYVITTYRRVSRPLNEACLITSKTCDSKTEKAFRLQSLMTSRLPVSVNCLMTYWKLFGDYSLLLADTLSLFQTTGQITPTWFETVQQGLSHCIRKYWMTFRRLWADLGLNLR